MFSTVAGPRIAYAWTWWNSRKLVSVHLCPTARDEGAPATIALPHRTSHPSRYVSRKRRWCADVLVIRLATDRRARVPEQVDEDLLELDGIEAAGDLRHGIEAWRA